MIREFFFDVSTVMWRDGTVLRRRLKKFIFSRLVTPLLYLVAFGWGLGRSITVESGTYLDFLVPGIIALNTMNVSYMGIVPIHAERVYHKSLEEYLIAPISPSAYVVGKIGSSIIRALISTVLILSVAFFFGAELNFFSDALRTSEFFSVVMLNSIIFAGIGFCAAMRVQTYEEVAQVNTYVLVPMSFLCGTFFQTDRLPEVVRFVVDILPLTHTSNLLRYGFDSTSFLILIFYAVILFLLARRDFKNISP